MLILVKSDRHSRKDTGDRSALETGISAIWPLTAAGNPAWPLVMCPDAQSETAEIDGSCFCVGPPEISVWLLYRVLSDDPAGLSTLLYSGDGPG